MGRHAGWTTAAAALAAERDGDAPHILLLPEVAFDEERFLAKVEDVDEASAVLMLDIVDRSGTESSQTPRWRGMDSKFQFRAR